MELFADKKWITLPTTHRAASRQRLNQYTLTGDTLRGLRGNVTLAESYEPYGSVLTSNGTASSIFGYAGEQVDTSRLVYLRARYMQPTLGIFLARDPWSGDETRPGSMNGWNYVEGDPINKADPLGTCVVMMRFPIVYCRIEPGDTMFGIAREYGVDPNYLIDFNREILKKQGVDDPNLIWSGKIIVIPRKGSNEPPPVTIPPNFQGQWGGVLYGNFQQLTRPNFGGRSLAWDLQGWCDDPPIAGRGWETVIDLNRGQKATFEYYYVGKSKGSSAIVEFATGVYFGLVTGFTDGPPATTLENYAGIAKCAMIPYGYKEVPGLSTTALAGLSLAAVICGPGQFAREPWTAEFSNIPGLWTALVEGQISFGIAANVSSEIIASYFRTSPIMPADQNEMDSAYHHLDTYAK